MQNTVMFLKKDNGVFFRGVPCRQKSLPESTITPFRKMAVLRDFNLDYPFSNLCACYSGAENSFGRLTKYRCPVARVKAVYNQR